MKTENVYNPPDGKEPYSTDNRNTLKPGLDKGEQDIKKHKNVSALVAASKGRSALTHCRAHAYKDIDFMHTGTNLSYGDEK